MKYRILSVCVLLSVMTFAQTKPKPKTTPAKPVTSNTPVLRNALDSFSYAMGMNLINYCNSKGVPTVNTSMLLKGLGDGSKPGKALFSDEQMRQVIASYVSKREAAQASVAKAAGAKFLAENAKKPGVVTLASGLQYMVLKAGTDTTKPKLTDQVKCHYHGTLINGFVFESSVQRGEPVTFPLGNVIRGWVEALQMMNVGSKWRLFIPSDLAYGDQQAGPDIPAGSTLIFDVELLEIIKQ